MHSKSFKHHLPDLPYSVAALEPYIDARTMTLHHEKHHAAYVDALNLALQNESQELQEKSAEWLLLNLNKVPELIRTQVRNHAGGHVNHSFFWQSMCADGGGKPTGLLADAIDQNFNSLTEFKAQFEAAGSKLLGSGWVWLIKSPEMDNTLHILATKGHDNPMTQGYVPLLVNDVWEHAYYLQYENRRSKYLKKWWAVVNWREVEQRFERSYQSTPLSTEFHGNSLRAVAK